MTLTRRRFVLSSVAAGATLPLAGACGTCDSPEPAPPAPPAQPPRTDPLAGVVIAATWEWGRTVCERGVTTLRAGRTLLDAIEEGIRAVEIDPAVRTVGVGGYPNEAGVVQLDAMIMKGSTLDAGAVGALEGISTPISVARRVMERTRHVYLMGAGARAFATEQGFETAELLTAEARADWERWRASGDPGFRRPAPAGENHDTVGAVGLDSSGEVIVGMSTSGLAWKMPGRVGDSPIVGAGGYADAEVGAACATGVGEEVIRTCGAYAIVERMRAGDEPEAAIREVLGRMRRRRGDALGDAQVAFIALRRDGAIGAASLRPGFELFVARGGAIEPGQPTVL